jgi:trehalose-phosphatase
MERLHANGTYELATIDPQVHQRIREINELLAKAGLSEMLEFKPTGTAVHWRGMLSSADVANMVRKVWLMSSQQGLNLIRFDGGLEIRAAGKNKGDIVRSVLGEMGKKAAIAYLGDDQTDEDAFAALQGFGLGVLVQSQYRPTVADVWVRPPEDVIAFLQDWISACGGE